MDDGFEFEGMWITDRMKSPCGRFELTPEQADELYGDPESKEADDD